MKWWTVQSTNLLTDRLTGQSRNDIYRGNKHLIITSYEKGFCQSCLQQCTQALVPSREVSHRKRISRPENEAATATGFEPQQDLPVSVFLQRNFFWWRRVAFEIPFSLAWTLHGNTLHISNRQAGSFSWGLRILSFMPDINLYKLMELFLSSVVLFWNWSALLSILFFSKFPITLRLPKGLQIVQELCSCLLR